MCRRAKGSDGGDLYEFIYIYTLPRVEDVLIKSILSHVKPRTSDIDSVRPGDAATPAPAPKKLATERNGASAACSSTKLRLHQTRHS